MGRHAKIISPDTQNEILSRLRKMPIARQVADDLHIPVYDVLKIGRLNGFDFKKGQRCPDSSSVRSEVSKLLLEITGLSRVFDVSKFLNISENTFKSWVNSPEIVTLEWTEEKIIKPLIAAFPDKLSEINRVSALSVEMHIVSATQIKKTVKAVQQDFRIATGILMREWRETCDLQLEDLQQHIKNPIVERNLPRLEAGAQIAGSIYREAIPAVASILGPILPDIAARYTHRLEQLKRHLGR